MLSAPGAVHPLALAAGVRRSVAEMGRRWPVNSRRRRGLRLGQGHLADHLNPVNSLAHMRWPMELERPVTAVHGGAAARVVTGRPSPANTWAREGCSSTGEPRRARCTTGRREGGAERSSPRSGHLRRARPRSGEQCPSKGALPREAGGSTGYARERRSSKKDRGTGGALRWTKQQRWRARARAVTEESRSDVLLLWGSEGNGGVTGHDWVSWGAGEVERGRGGHRTPGVAGADAWRPRGARRLPRSGMTRAGEWRRRGGRARPASAGGPEGRRAAQ
jgi:hypothetical protein